MIDPTCGTAAFMAEAQRIIRERDEQDREQQARARMLAVVIIGATVFYAACALARVYLFF